MRSFQTLTVLALAGHSLARPDGVGGHHAHHTDHGAVAAPSDQYAEPSAGYAEPSASGYAAPDAGYGAPDAGYGAPSYSSGSGAGYYDTSATGGFADDSINPFGNALSGSDGMSMILIPLLVVAALFLLIPGVTTVPVNAGTGRKKRATLGELHKHKKQNHKHIPNIDISIIILHTKHTKPTLEC